MGKPVKRSFIGRWLLPLTLGPAATAGMVAWLWYSEEDLGVPAAYEVVTSEPSDVVGVEEPPSSFRNVTPEGVTPGPLVEGALERITPQIREEAPRPEPETLFRRVLVLSASSFRAVVKKKTVVVTLDGISTPEFDAVCTDPAGAKWKCGAKARAELARLIGGRSVSCRIVDNSYPQEPLADCHVGKDDLGDWMVQQGWADSTDATNARRAAFAEEAKREKRGRFGSAPAGVIAG